MYLFFCKRLKIGNTKTTVLFIVMINKTARPKGSGWLSCCIQRSTLSTLTLSVMHATGNVWHQARVSKLSVSNEALNPTDAAETRTSATTCGISTSSWSTGSSSAPGAHPGLRLTCVWRGYNWVRQPIYYNLVLISIYSMASPFLSSKSQLTHYNLKV